MIHILSAVPLWTTAVIMILLEVGNSSVTNVSYRLLTPHAVYVASERRYPNHPRGEMRQVSPSHFPTQPIATLTVSTPFAGHLHLTSSSLISTMSGFIYQPQIGKRNSCYP